MLIVFGLLTLSEWIFGTSLGIDQLLAHDPAVGGVAGRASPQTAAAFLLFGLTQFTLDAPQGPRRRVQTLAGLGFAFVVGSVALGYLYGSSVLTGSVDLTGVSPPTAVGLVALLVAVACERPDREPTFWLWSSGPAGVVARRLAGAALVAAPALAFVRLVGQEAGWYDVRFGLALFTGSMIVIFLAIATWTARAVDRGEKLQRELRAIFDHVPAPMVMRDRGGRYVHANAYVTRSLGLSLEELAGTRAEDHFEPEVIAQIRAQDEQVLRSRESFTDEIAVPHSDGSMHDYYVVKYPVLDDSGEVEGFGSFSLDITDRKRAEARLREAEERFRGTFEEAPIGVALVAADGAWLRANRALCEIIGYSEQELLGMSFQDITHPEDLDADLENVRQMLSGAIRTYQMEKRYLHKQGQIVWIRLSVSLVRDVTGEPLHFVSQIEDITAAKHADESLREAQARIEAIFHHIPAGLSLRDLDGRYLHVNQYAADALGCAPAELTGTDPGEHLDEQTRQRVRAEDAEMRRTRQPIAQEFTLLHSDGTDHDYHVVRYPVLDDRGEVTAFGSFTLDVAARKRAERTLARTLDQLQEAQRTARLGSWTWDPAADTATWSAEMYRIFGRDPEQGPATSDAFFQYVHPDDRERLAAGYAQTFGGGPAFELDYRIITSANGERTVHALGRRDPVHPGCYAGTVQDVTALREAEREARRERDYAATITRSMREGFVLTRDGVILDVNDALCELTGFSREELLGASAPFPFWAPDTTDELQRTRERVLEQDGGEFEAPLMRKDGTRFEASLTAVPARGPDDVLMGYVTTVRDISQQKRYEAELKRLARHDPLTELANRRVFHEELDAEVTRAKRHDRSLSIAILDLDHFKHINDQHGHPAGDRVLTEAARRLSTLVREGEVLARVGGEEFAWIIPDSGAIGAYAAAERARQAIAATEFPEVGALTLSAGVCELGDADNVQQLYEHADKALYWAKQHGRNQTFRYTEQSARQISDRALARAPAGAKPRPAKR